ncbi:hypothetical protein HSX11_27600 [Oxalobacteraceae bacterium]|nr:hypothetical protein [Oxalobacteraceae bacterium]
MSEEQKLRQVALVSYGTLFLQGKLDLEEWYRHGIFWNARFQFRVPANKGLLADDFTLWLGSLREQGAVRLSLHLAAGLPDAEPLGMAWAERMVIVHFADRHQCWALAEELAEWRCDDDDGRSRAYPDAAYYAGEVDCYCLMEESAGVPAIPETDWKALAYAIRGDLDEGRRLSGAKPLAGYAPYCVAMRSDSEWAKLPVIPNSPQLAMPHRLLAMLDAERATFSNDTHVKNENSDYKNLSDQQTAEVTHWGQRLDSWIVEVQLRAANELRWSGGRADKNEFLRWTTPPAPLAKPAGGSATETASQPFIAAGSGGATAVKKETRWVRGLVMLLLIAIVAVFVMAGASLVVKFPWLSIFCGMIAVALLSALRK